MPEVWSSRNGRRLAEIEINESRIRKRIGRILRVEDMDLPITIVSEQLSPPWDVQSLSVSIHPEYVPPRVFPIATVIRVNIRAYQAGVRGRRQMAVRKVTLYLYRKANPSRVLFSVCYTATSSQSTTKCIIS